MQLDSAAAVQYLYYHCRCNHVTTSQSTSAHRATAHKLLQACVIAAQLIQAGMKVVAVTTNCTHLNISAALVIGTVFSIRIELSLASNPAAVLTAETLSL
jgi:hypothetical protein